METHPGAIVALTIAIYLQLEPRKEARSRAVEAGLCIRAFMESLLGSMVCPCDPGGIG